MAYYVPKDRKYSSNHYWVKVDDGIATFGLTDYWQQNSGIVTDVDITFSSGTKNQDDKFGEITASSLRDLFMPIAGTFSSKNTALSTTPGLVNSDCYGQGWLIKVSSYDGLEYDELMSAEDYSHLID